MCRVTKKHNTFVLKDCLLFWTNINSYFIRIFAFTGAFIWLIIDYLEFSSLWSPQIIWSNIVLNCYCINLQITFDFLSDDYAEKCAEYEELDKLFKSEEKRLKQQVDEIKKEILVREYLIKEYEKTEDKLTDQAKTCKTVLESLVHHSGLLHDKIDRKK